MIIALDYDRTFTKDPDLWWSFIRLAQNRDHEVLVVTRRNGEREPVQESFEYSGVKVCYTSRKPKAVHMNKLGIKVDIWIDDDPGSILGVS